MAWNGVVAWQNIKMFLRDNYIHGDLHAGNVLYVEREDGHLQATIIDAVLSCALVPSVVPLFAILRRTIVLQGRTLNPYLLQGLTTSIKADAQTPFGNFLYGCCTANAELIVDQLIFCNEGKHAVSRDDLLRDITAAVQRWIGDGGRAPDGGPVSTSEYS